MTNYIPEHYQDKTGSPVPASRLNRIISEIKMVGNSGTCAMMHPFNYGDLTLEYIAMFGVRYHCQLAEEPFFRSPYGFFPSYFDRESPQLHDLRSQKVDKYYRARYAEKGLDYVAQ